MARLTQAVIDKILPAIVRALFKAHGESGWGMVSVEFRNGKPTIESENREREEITDEAG